MDRSWKNTRILKSGANEQERACMHLQVNTCSSYQPTAQLREPCWQGNHESNQQQPPSCKRAVIHSSKWQSVRLSHVLYKKLYMWNMKNASRHRLTNALGEEKQQRNSWHSSVVNLYNHLLVTRTKALRKKPKRCWRDGNRFPTLGSRPDSLRLMQLCNPRISNNCVFARWHVSKNQPPAGASRGISATGTCLYKAGFRGV